KTPLQPISPPQKVLFIYARGGGAPNVAGTDTGANEIIRLAGAENAVSSFAGYRPLSPESLVTSATDAVLMTRQGLEAMGGELALWQLPGIRQTPAGKNRKLVLMDEVLLLGFGPRTVSAADQLRKA